MIVRFTLPGRPVPKERPRVLRNGRTFTPARTEAYEAAIAEEAMVALQRSESRNCWPVDAWYKLECIFNVSGVKLLDGDNALKSVQDGLEAKLDKKTMEYGPGLYRNDSHVCKGSYSTYYKQDEDSTEVILQVWRTEMPT